DVGGWTDEYPMPVIGSAAVAGVAAGWAMGRAARSGTKTDGTSKQAPTGERNGADTTDHVKQPHKEEHPATRLVSGLGTLAGAFASAVVGAASEAVVGVVKDTVRDSLRPEPAAAPSANGNE